LDSLRSLWSGLDTRRKALVIGATLAMFLALLALGRGGAARDMELLYSGLDGRAAGDVIAALEQQGVAHDIRGTAIFVPAADRDRLRMALAAEGLPASGTQGYELLDSLSGFGTTSQMFDAAYWRAKEGELARTIAAAPHVASARVHIATSGSDPFARDREPSAAVTVATTGAPVTPDQAQALRFLIAAAVSGLGPDGVSVIDDRAGLIGGPEAGPSVEDRSLVLRDSVTRLLEARVGPGNAVVEVTVDTVTDRETIVERRVDPESRVAISTEVEEQSIAATDSADGDVTVASNLPDGDGAEGGGQSSSTESQTRQITNFEISETSREIERGPGAIRRLTVAVLINALPPGEDGAIADRSPDELQALEALVASAVGFDEARGDVITLRTLPFEQVTLPGTEAAAPAGLPIDPMQIARIAVPALVVLILGLFVVRPILLSGRQSSADLPPPDPALSLPAAAPDPQIAQTEAADQPEDPVARLRNLIESRQTETVQILQTWIEDPEKRETS